MSIEVEKRGLLNEKQFRQLPNSGLESTVSRVKDDGGRDLILKKRKPTGRQNYLFEAYAYRQLKALDALVPEAVRVSPDELLMTAIAGQEMDDQPNLYTSEQFFADIATNLALCNGVTFQGFGPTILKGDLFTGEYNSWSDFLDTTERLFESPEFTESGLGENSLAKLHSAWNAQKPNMQLEQGRLVHGDFAMSSIFVDNGKLTGIIDFGDAFIGDPLMDIAYFRFKEITKPYGEDIYRRLLRHYAKVRDLTVNDKLEQKIIFYMVYWGLKRLEHCPDEELRGKFADKLEVVANKLQR